MATNLTRITQTHDRATDTVVTAESTVNGVAMRFVTEYSDYSMVDGVLVHHRENKWVGSMNTAVLRLQHITVDAEFDDDEFEPVENRTDPVIARIAGATAAL